MSHSHRQQLRRGIRLNVEALEDRQVPSVTALDLSTRGSEGAVGDAVFRQSDAQPTGTGVIRSFVRLQTNAPTEQGYNTAARPLQFDENKSPQFTRSLRVGDVPLVSVGGVLYREFLLDVNQKASAPLISLDELRVYVGSAADLGGYDAVTKQLSGLAPVYDLDGVGDHSVTLNYRLNSGSGSGDMTFLVPATLLGSDPNQFLYLFSAFGHNHAGNAGFEEWAVRATPSPDNPPPVALSSLSGHVFHDVNENGVFDAGDLAIAGAIITLNGVNDVGQNVVLVATTDANGFYKFADLRPGIYTLLEDQPLGFDDGTDTIGTQGGQTANDRFFDIFLAAGIDGFDNNFGELLAPDGGGES